MDAGMCGGGAEGVNRGYVRNPCKDFMRAYKAGETRPSASSYILADRIKTTEAKTFVSEPVTIIVGAPDLFVNKGSTINLTCVVRYAPEPPPMMIWSHNTEVINFDSPRGGISLVTEKGPETTSRLMIQKAVQSDSGIYTCEPSNANPSSIKVHVVNGT
ncbi:hypothetical protein K0M31_017148 [Melipona bicolor]|uniref:Ig-like domain-containing protein n=1 Tax=Melipona bicolor TaxID=60889 RepID=A0AA40FDD2_9HYME|nr:hypothetical protein K0M31_017148 [Melipona bicolor]